MINNFMGKNFYLSNFYKTDVRYDGILYHSTEAAFQASKTTDMNLRMEIAEMSPDLAKKAGRKLELRSDWEQVKDKVMYEVCLTKFLVHDDLKDRLLATGDEELVEGNTWHDNYWGDCTCEKCKDIPGKNMLGKTLMMIREQLRNEDNDGE